MKMLRKKIVKALSFCFLICSMTATPVMAAEPSGNAAGNETGMELYFITPEQMEQLIVCREAGIAAYNWFPDSVLVTISKEADGHCKVVFMNNGFPFDRCDVTGTICLSDMSMRIVANRVVEEYKLVYGWARVIDIYSVGGQYATGSYSLTLSDGDTGTMYVGVF
ncbi:MAG: hypothetical protein LBQ15_10750 [Clostridium sp.]|jgi:hypothetical protein|nr:hypothetical protein [Clostridium sp.]